MVTVESGRFSSYSERATGWYVTLSYLHNLLKFHFFILLSGEKRNNNAHISHQVIMRIKLNNTYKAVETVLRTFKHSLNVI